MDCAVRFVDVRKEYPFYQHITAGVKSFLFNLPRSLSAFRKTRFEALKGVSFEVRKGETFGIIGRNGSGKSTILSLIANVIRQDGGRIEINGKISSLLELGAGFHPDLSGIENIIMNGILMGSRRDEILKKADEIIAFSELGEFIYQPLRTYSSGMQMRLGFSVAIHIEPEILLIDEALAVGDISFQKKCQSKMEEFKKSGTTIIIVSHDMTAIAKLCDQVAFVESGSIMDIGRPITVIKSYLRHIGQPIHIDIDEDQQVDETDTLGNRDTTEIPEPSADLLKTALEPVTPRDNQEILPLPVQPVSWWDSPVIMQVCEERITGDQNIDLYGFLKKEFFIEHLQRGLSICCKLKGIENNFINNYICKFFDVLGDADFENILGGTGKFNHNFYDLFLCIDFLNSIENLDVFLRNINASLTENGVVAAFEYIGPINFERSDPELRIAQMLLKALKSSEREDNTGIATPIGTEHAQVTRMRKAVSSQNVIPALTRCFDILAIRYFAGPLHDLVLGKVLDRYDTENEKDMILIKTILQCENILINQGILKNHYAMIIAKKRAA